MTVGINKSNEKEMKNENEKKKIFLLLTIVDYQLLGYCFKLV